MVRPTLEYRSEVWEAKKTQAAALQSLMLGGAKHILGCSSKTCNEAVRGLDTLQGRRDKNKFKWWYKLAKLFTQERNFKPQRGKQRSKVMDDLFSSLGLDKAEWLHDIPNRDCSLKGFLSIVGDSINEREIRQFEEGLNSKVKLLLYKTFNKVVEFKKYLHGKSDTGLD